VIEVPLTVCAFDPAMVTTRLESTSVPLLATSPKNATCAPEKNCIVPELVNCAFAANMQHKSEQEMSGRFINFQVI
jgi:hypothetical protein